MSDIINLQTPNLPATCYVFKHSTVCPISARAAEVVKSASIGRLVYPVYWINVREQRNLSDWVAETYSVRHESPQLLLLENGKAIRVWNHGEVREDRL
jgi:bacillithiol system protein YtxJ